MSRPFAFFLLFLLVLSTPGCEKEPITPREYPRLKTLPVVDVSPQGATFRAEIIYRGDFSIQRYGFVWSTRENPQVDVDDQVAVAKNIQESSFSSTVTGTLQEDVTYYVRAFVETPDYTVYGANVTFDSEGSAGPRITRVVPLTGTVGDTVRLSGENFSFVTARNQVSFNDRTAETVASTDTSLLVLVPPLTTTSATISLDILGRQATFTEPFQVTTPTISAFAPTTAGFGDTVTMQGSNFSLLPIANAVRVGPAIAEVVRATKTELQFLVPSNLTVAQNEVSLLIAGQEAGTDEILTIPPPQINALTPNDITTYYSGEITITGEHFNPLPEGNVVRFNGNRAEVRSSSRQQLTVSFPRPLLPNELITVIDTPTLEIQVLDQTAVQEQALHINYQSRWTRMGDFPGPPRTLGIAFAAGGKGYVGLGQTEQREAMSDFWTYDPGTDSWTTLPDFPGGARSRSMTMVFDDVVYLVGGTPRQGPSGENKQADVWAFDTQTQVWTRRNDFPGGPRAAGFSFVLDGYGYLGAGDIFDRDRNDDLWRYDPTTDSWTQLNDVPFDMVGFNDDFLALSDGQYGYVLGDACGVPCSARFFWRYDPETDSWAEMPRMPDNSAEAAGFVLNGKLYAGTGIFSQVPGHFTFFEYDPLANSWRRVDFIDRRHGAKGFSIGPHGYLLLGEARELLQDVWRFNPDLP